MKRNYRKVAERSWETKTDIRLRQQRWTEGQTDRLADKEGAMISKYYMRTPSYYTTTPLLPASTTLLMSRHLKPRYAVQFVLVKLLA